ncbi:MAG: sugar ABC transporter permease [Chloroflexi bacterium]|nr:MAG: sugar ABC transporter permease [Chloroflexota bacterium]
MERALMAKSISRPRTRQKSRLQQPTFFENAIFLGPLLFFLILLYGALMWTFYVSLADWATIAPNYEFIGLKWYRFLMAQPRFTVDVANNLKWLLLGVIPTVMIAIFLAYFLELTPYPKVEAYIRTLILYPMAMSFIVTGTIWSWMYEPGRGVINTVLRSIGIDATFRYTTNPTTATYWLILIFIWQYLGFAVIIVQSSLRTAELQELVEAARVDGATRLRILFSVIIPNIRAGLLILVSLLLISTLKVFDIVFIVTYGGPGISTDVLALNMWITTFQQHLVSAGAGIGMIIFALSFILVIPYTLYAFRKWFS